MSDPLAAIRRLVEDIRPIDRQEEADRDHVASSSAGALCRKKGGRDGRGSGADTAPGAPAGKMSAATQAPQRTPVFR